MTTHSETGSFDLSALNNLNQDLTQYFWFEEGGSGSYPWGLGAHVTLYPQSDFTNPNDSNYLKGQNILINTDGFSLRNGTIPLMALDNDSLDFNLITDLSQGTYVNVATFGTSGATIGQLNGAHSVIDANGQRFYANDGTSLLVNIGYGEGAGPSGAAGNYPYFTFGSRYGSIGGYSQTFGSACEASGFGSIASGLECTASGNYSSAFGLRTIADGMYAFAENGGKAYGVMSHAEGADSIAYGYCSHVGGIGTSAGYDYQTVVGKYNDNKSVNLFEIGNGTYNTPNNAFEVDTSGNVNIPSGAKYKINGTALSASDVGAVPTSRTVNGNALSSDVILSASDVGALPIAGGTMTGQIQKASSASSWVQGRANALVRNTNTTYSANNYNPIVSVKSINGTWDIGTYTTNNGLYFTYITDANFNSNTNTATQHIYINGSDGVLNTKGIKASGSIISSNHSSAIGTVKVANAAAKTVNNNTNTNLTSISLEAGTWVVTGGVRFPANATGLRRMNIATSSGSANADVQTPAVNGGSTQLAYTVVLSPTATTTYYLNCYQNSGSNLSLIAGGGENGINFIRAVRIA